MKKAEKVMKGYLKIWITIQILIVRFIIRSCSHQAFFEREEGKYLANSVIRMEQAGSELDCGALCSRDRSCVSVNYKLCGKNQGLCELNSKSLDDSEEKEVVMPEYINLAIIERTCEETDEFFSPQIKKCVKFSCKDMLESDSSLTDGVYNLKDIPLNQYAVYCHMTNIVGCGGGGWTLVMKLDGSKKTFDYNSLYWSDKRTYGVQEGLGGLNDKEIKMESYWKTQFTNICLGMKVSGVTKWIKLKYEATSLHSLITDGQFRATMAGRDTWKGLIDGSSLQKNCNKEGFNIRRGNDFIRLGFIANQENNCRTCDSWIAYGIKTGLNSSMPTTGNWARFYGDNGNRDIPAFGYILVS